EAREKFSPLAACWTSELGGLNKVVHTWVYKDLTERTRVPEASRQAGGAWPPQTGVRPIRQENKLLIAAAFSPERSSSFVTMRPRSTWSLPARERIVC